MNYDLKVFFYANIISLGVLPSICEALHKFDLFFILTSGFRIQSSQLNTSWKLVVKRKIKDYEENAWLSFVSDHPNFQIARSCLANLSPEKFWAITAEYLDLVCRLHVQIRMMCLLGLNGGIPWLLNTDGALCFVILKLLITFFLIALPFARIFSLHVAPSVKDESVYVIAKKSLLQERK